MNHPSSYNHMEQVKLYFKSDFKVFLSASDNWAVPFKIKFWTGSPSSSFIACHHGTEYNNCKLLEDGRLMVAFDDHNMGRGKLMMEVHLFLNDEDYRTGICDQVIAPQAVVCQVTAEESRTDVMSASAGMGAGRYAVEAGIVMHYGDTVKVTSEYQALVYDNAQFNGGPLAAQMRGTAVWVCKESEKTVWVGCSGPGPQELPVEIISAIVKDAEVVLDMQGEKTLDVVCELPPFYQKGEKGDKGEPGAKGEPGLTTEEHDALVAATNDANRAAVIAMSATQRANASADAADSAASSASSATVRANRSAQMADAAAKRAEDSVLDLDKLESEVGNVKEKLDNNDGGTHNYVGARSGGVSIMCDKGNYEGSRIDVEDDGIYIESETDSINLSSPNYVEIISGTFPNNSRIMAKGTNVSIAADSATLNGKAIATEDQIPSTDDFIKNEDYERGDDGVAIKKSDDGVRIYSQNRAKDATYSEIEVTEKGVFLNKSGTFDTLVELYDGRLNIIAPSATINQKEIATEDDIAELGQEVGKVEKSAEEQKKENAELREDLTELEAVALVDCEMKYGQPRVLYGAGTPQEAIVPDNWVGMDEGGCYWNGQPIFVGQVYININATSNGRYTGVRNANYGDIVWKNF